MKKMILATAVVATALLSACDHNAPKANLETAADSLSYEVGLAYSGNAQRAMQQMMIDSTALDEFIKGIKEGVNMEDDKKKMAYIIGLQVGMGANLQALGSIEEAAFAGDSTKSLSRKNFLAALISVIEGKEAVYVVDGDTINSYNAYGVMNKHLEAIRETTMQEKYGEYKKQNADWLAENAKKEGVKTLDGGVQYKVLTEGKGALPVDSQTVKVRYEGRLIDGKVFDTSDNMPEKTANFPVGNVIEGMKIALRNMPVGSEWEVYIPAELGYRGQQAGEITPFSTLIFKLTLVGINE